MNDIYELLLLALTESSQSVTVEMPDQYRIMGRLTSTHAGLPGDTAFELVQSTGSSSVRVRFTHCMVVEILANNRGTCIKLDPEPEV